MMFSFLAQRLSVCITTGPIYVSVGWVGEEWKIMVDFFRDRSIGVDVFCEMLRTQYEWLLLSRRGL